MNMTKTLNLPQKAILVAITEQIKKPSKGLVETQASSKKTYQTGLIVKSNSEKYPEGKLYFDYAHKIDLDDDDIKNHFPELKDKELIIVRESNVLLNIKTK